MGVAFSVWDNRISPVFDSSRLLLIVNIENRIVTTRRYEPLNCESPFSRAEKLFDLGVETLICGAISNVFGNMIEAYGIRIIHFVRGEVNQVIDAYLRDMLSAPDFRMAGSTPSRHRCLRGGQGGKKP